MRKNGKYKTEQNKKGIWITTKGKALTIISSTFCGVLKFSETLSDINYEKIVRTFEDIKFLQSQLKTNCQIAKSETFGTRKNFALGEIV